MGTMKFFELVEKVLDIVTGVFISGACVAFVLYTIYLSFGR
jgi:hypothetical protein